MESVGQLTVVPIPDRLNLIIGTDQLAELNRATPSQGATGDEFRM
jgi:hypothetical protein